MSVFERLESNVRSYCRAFPVTFDRATGAEIFGRDGTRYIDFLSGCGSLNYGHNNPVLKNALIDYVSQDGISLSLDMHTAAKERFLSALETHILRPRGLEYRVQFPGPTGANAVEAALKLARKVTGRSNVIFFTNGFHGVTLGAVATTGNGYHRQGAALPLGGTTAMPYDGYFGPEIDTVAQLDRMIGDPSSGIDAPAAIIVECVQGEGGLTAARAEWLRGVEAVCRRHGALLIVDDIQAGCGRTGDFFSFEEAGLSPDIVTLSKSLSGFGLPFSLVLLKPEIDIWKPAEHNGTFRGNNLAFVTAAAMIETYWSEDAFAGTVRAKGERLGARLSAMAAAWPGAILGVRGRGMMRGLLCADAEAAGAIARACFERGLIIERSGPHDEVVKCLAPLVIEDDVLAEGLDLLEDAVLSVLGQPGHAIAAEQHAFAPDRPGQKTCKQLKTGRCRGTRP